MDLLTLIKQFCMRTGIPEPSFVLGNTDQQVKQLLGLLNEVLEDLASRSNWAATTQEAVFTTVDGEDQGSMESLAPNGFKWILEQTIFDRTRKLPLYGPMSPEKWQAFKALPTTGPLYRYRIARGKLLFMPEAIAGHICAFEYASSWGAVSSDGLTFRQYPAVDTDKFLISPTVVLAGLRWKWKSEKGLDYAEDFTRFESLLADEKGREGSKAPLSMDSQSTRVQPGIFVTPGSWNVP